MLEKSEFFVDSVVFFEEIHVYFQEIIVSELFFLQSELQMGGGGKEVRDRFLDYILGHFKVAILANLGSRVKKLLVFGLFFEHFVSELWVKDPKNARYLVFIIKSDLVAVLRHRKYRYFIDRLYFFKNSLAIKFLVFDN